MFERAKVLPPAGVTFYFDGVAMLARPGDSVAAALLANGVRIVRSTPAGGRPRGPYCMMGVCFDCLVTIDGAANQQSCMIPVAAGMVVGTQARPGPWTGAARHGEGGEP
ncbi:(2Fe-2S)-binding protein [Paraburkholderia sp.]|uniref:(2Fe-2S)-binding protein n=1 Tax=Paraburkholderia sp. TaxID=1926495 RepID=UPI0039E22256